MPEMTDEEFIEFVKESAVRKAIELVTIGFERVIIPNLIVRKIADEITRIQDKAGKGDTP